MPGFPRMGGENARPIIEFSDRAEGFAVPMTTAIRQIIRTLRAGLEVEYGFLGVRTPPLPLGKVQIDPNRGIVSGSPAEQAGLLPGDFILSINGHKVTRSDDVGSFANE